MSRPLKGKSPFYPGQPVPVELFAGRMRQIRHILDRGAAQVAAGKPVAIFVQGEYGIGKSSIANFTQWAAEREYGLHSIYSPLGGVETTEAVGAAIAEATLRSGAFHPTRADRIRNWLSRYVGEQSLFGITLRADALRKDAPAIAGGLLPFLGEVHARLRDTGVRGLFLVIDEINGIAANPKFAHMLKGLVDTNAVAEPPLPLLLMLCGVEERRREMIRHHQPIERIFDIVEIAPMSPEEMADFFARAFDSVQVRIEKDAMDLMIEYSAGFPKVMHLIGDAAFWLDQTGTITRDVAQQAVTIAADEVGKKYVDQQVYREIRSRDYHSILKKVVRGSTGDRFDKGAISALLTEAERRKFGNFLQRMKRLNVLRQGEARGEYVFSMPMVRLYILLDSLRKNGASH